MFTDPLICERCGSELESDDAVSIIEGVCARCRQPTSQPPDDEVVRQETAVAFTWGADGDVEATGLERESPAIGLAELLACRMAETPSEPPRKEPREEPRGRIASDAFVGFPGEARRSNRARRRRRDLGIGTAVGLLLTVIVAGYFLTRGDPNGERMAIRPTTTEHSIVLTVTPPWATVKLDGRETGPADPAGRLTVWLPKDELSGHSLEVSAEGYHGIRRPLSSYSGVEEVSVELIRRPYEVAVQTQPPGAEVWLDGTCKGQSPLTLTLLASESPVLSVRLHGYVGVARKLTPPERGSVVELDLVLEAAKLVVEVESDPGGAAIMVDGIVQGTAPLAVELDPTYFGQEVEISASLPGYDETTQALTLPFEPGDAPVAARVCLVRQKAEIAFQTDPPGAQMTVDGKDLGCAPVVVTFPPEQVGKTIVVTGSLAGSHYGRREIVVPPPGEPADVSIPLEFNAHRVVFVIMGSPASQLENLLIEDQVVELIHALTPAQRFAVLAQIGDGVEAWPGGLGTQAASSEQKVRAYDMIRSQRPSTTGSLAELLRLALEFQPNAVWLFCVGDVERDELLQFSDWATGADVSVHIVRTASDAQDQWIEQWARQHRGTYTVLGRDELPFVAFGKEP
ncbi:MAG: PEGA domain-containing protein [Planctomycetota bacterium]